MAEHDMGPSTVAGFSRQCRKCKALDTEIMFALGQNCPVDDLEPAEEPMEGTISLGATVQPVQVQAQFSQQMEWHLFAAQLQSHWFQGYAYRQLLRANGQL